MLSRTPAEDGPRRTGEQPRRAAGGSVLGGDRARSLARQTWWRARDYAWVVRRQGEALLSRTTPEDWADPSPRRTPDVVLVPGVYEPWRFLSPVARALHRRGHRIHVLPDLGWNHRPVADGAHRLVTLLRDRGLVDVVVVAHSKGGLIGKAAMLAEPDRVRHLVAVATPFAGSTLARFFPLASVRAFVPTDATLLALAAERAVDARITSAYSCWDPHIPSGSVLPGAARNVELATPGHFRVLADPALPGLVRDVLDAGPP